jgi:hypothetical protein
MASFDSFGDKPQTPNMAHVWLADYSLSAPQLRAEITTPVKDQTPAKEQTPPEEEVQANDDKSHTFDPCKTVAQAFSFAPGSEPHAMERVQDVDPVLYDRIKNKVKDPRYIGQTGDITESTHDKKGHINGCTFIQNTPYWLDHDAAQSFIDLNKALASKHKQIEVDHLNGAGRTLGQEEGIAWRNTGLHAKPGKSNHGFGRAIDIQDHEGESTQPSADKDVREALHANGFRQGDSYGPLKNDLHHWSYTGPGRATEGHQPPAKHVYHGHHSSHQKK